MILFIRTVVTYIKGLVYPKMYICWKCTCLRCRWVCFLIRTDLEKFSITSFADHLLRLLWCFYQLFGIHWLQRIHWWASNVMLNFPKFVLMNTQTHQILKMLVYLISQQTQLVLLVSQRPQNWWKPSWRAKAWIWSSTMLVWTSQDL